MDDSVSTTGIILLTLLAVFFRYLKAIVLNETTEEAKLVSSAIIDYCMSLS